MRAISIHRNCRRVIRRRKDKMRFCFSPCRSRGRPWRRTFQIHFLLISHFNPKYISIRRNELSTMWLPPEGGFLIWASCSTGTPRGTTFRRSVSNSCQRAAKGRTIRRASKGSKMWHSLDTFTMRRRLQRYSNWIIEWEWEWDGNRYKFGIGAVKSASHSIIEI